MQYGREKKLIFNKVFWLIIQLLTGTHGQGQLVFRSLMHQPRIYHGAPPGVHVTTVHAYDPDNPRNNVIYNLPNVLDYDYFVLDKNSGNLTTAKHIERSIGETYQVKVAAVSFGTSELEHLTIAVTEFNQFAPRFERLSYQAELPVQAPVDTLVLQVRALDPDPLPHNAEVYYRMDQNISTHFFSLDPLSGELKLARPLNTTEDVLTFGVFAEDGGSPKRWAHVQVEIFLKTLSAPREVHIPNVTVSTATICWSPPEFGLATGYLINCRTAEDTWDNTLNITSENGKMCATLRDLKGETEYTCHITGWNQEGTGQQTQAFSFKTVVDYCARSICQTGVCAVLETDPWYRCNCVNGYYGAHCELFNPCARNPCVNNGTCLNTTHNEYVCDCPLDYSGPNCGSYNPCLRQSSLCMNGGTCAVTTNHTYLCICPNGYYGHRCHKINRCFPEPCHNGGTCSNASNDTFTCTCPSGFTGKLCEEDIDECVSSPCYQGATCRNRKGNFTCICTPGHTGHTCETSVQCPQDTTDTDRGTFYWNATDHNTTVQLECPYGPLDPKETEVFAERTCYVSDTGTAFWGAIEALRCRGKNFVVAEGIADELRSLTVNSLALNGEKLKAAAQGVESIASLAAQDRKLAQDMVTVISNVLNANSTVLGAENGNISDSLLQAVDEFASNVRLQPGENTSLETENIHIHVLQWHPESSPEVEEVEGLKFEVPLKQSATSREPTTKPSEGATETGVGDRNDTEVEKEVGVVKVYLPSEALMEAHLQLNDDVRVKFVVYYNHKLFQPKPTTTESHITNPGVSTTSGEPFPTKVRPMENAIDSIDTPVVQISVGDVSVKTLDKPLIYIFPLATAQVAKCVYWLEFDRAWATDGLTTNQTKELIICKSTHLTAFSVLLDPTPEVLIAKVHSRVLSTMSYVGCALSLIGLTLTIITYSLFRSLNRDHTGKILLNLCVSLFFMNAIFLLGGLTVPNAKQFCTAVALLLQYFLLSSLSWMCCEAANMYQLLIHVFATAETHFMLKRCLFAWGIPMIFVIATISAGLGSYYNGNQSCILTPRNTYVYYFTFLGPACAILLVNLTVFLLVARVLFTPRLARKTTAGNNPIMTLAQIRGAFTVMILLGVTWGFGMLSVSEARVVFQYLFCVFNSMQGFLIFLVRCLLYPEARSAWVQLIKYGKFKKYRGVFPPGIVSFSTNSHSAGKHAHTTTTALRKSSDGVCAISNNVWNGLGAGQIEGVAHAHHSGAIIKTPKSYGGQTQPKNTISPPYNHSNHGNSDSRTDGYFTSESKSSAHKSNNLRKRDQFGIKNKIADRSTDKEYYQPRNDLVDESKMEHNQPDLNTNTNNDSQNGLGNVMRGYANNIYLLPSNLQKDVENVSHAREHNGNGESPKEQRSSSLDTSLWHTRRRNIPRRTPYSKSLPQGAISNKSKRRAKCRTPIVLETKDDCLSDNSTSTDVEENNLESGKEQKGDSNEHF